MDTAYNNAVYLAALNGHTEIVKFLHETRKEECTTDAMDWAAENGDLELVKFLHETRKGCTPNAMDWAVRNGRIMSLKTKALVGAANAGLLQHHHETGVGIPFSSLNRRVVLSSGIPLETTKCLPEKRKEEFTTNEMDRDAKKSRGTG